MALPAANKSAMSLFGGDKPWSPLDWTDSDDRVRGGSSQSYLDITSGVSTATFRGTLDTQTLGGAGFASQRTTAENRTWDLSAYDGIEIAIAKFDAKRYTLTLKDELLPARADGRDQSTVSWEWDFVVGENGTAAVDARGATTVFVPWNVFKATYRGREQPNAKPLDLKNVRRFSLMMRSFFAQQDGEFELVISSIKAVKEEKRRSLSSEPRSSWESVNEKKVGGAEKRQGWVGWVFGGCGIL